MKIPMLDPRIEFEASYKNFFKEFKNNILQEVRAKFGVQHPTLHLSNLSGIVQSQLTEFLSGNKKISIVKLLDLSSILELTPIERDFLIKINAVIELKRLGKKDGIYDLLADKEMAVIPQNEIVQISLIAGGDLKLINQLFISVRPGQTVEDIASSTGVSPDIVESFFQKLFDLGYVKIDKGVITPLYETFSRYQREELEQDFTKIKRHRHHIVTSKERIENYKKNLDYYNWQMRKSIQNLEGDILFKVETSFFEEDKVLDQDYE